jgi:hypothetical protein
VAGYSAKNFQKKNSLLSARWLGTRQRIFLIFLPQLSTRQRKILCRCANRYRLFFAAVCQVNGRSHDHFSLPSAAPGTWQSLYRVPDKKHSAKRSVPVENLPCAFCRERPSAKALPRTKLPLPSALCTCTRQSMRIL